MLESAEVGTPVGKLKATDDDLGINADIKYTIINSEGANMFSISTNRDTKEGIVSLKKVRSSVCTEKKSSLDLKWFMSSNQSRNDGCVIQSTDVYTPSKIC